MDALRELGEDLRRLRLSRGLSLGTAAALAGVAKGTVFAWENGARPRGPALVRLLDALGADARRRARLLHAADPAHARVSLVRTPLGPPVHLGHVVRAMRIRRGVTQADLARRVGLTQGAVARWESGDSSPDAATLHGALFALGATPEEVAAATVAAGEGPGELPEDLGAASLHLGLAISHAPPGLHEILLLGFEAEVWRRASRDGRWDALLCEIAGNAANRHVVQGRLQEARFSARRALALASTPEGRLGGVAAVGTLANLAQMAAGDPGAILRRIEGWMDRLPTRHRCGYWSWAHKDRGLFLADVGRLDEAEAAVGRAAEAIPDGDEPYRRWQHAAWLVEIRLRAGQPRTALPMAVELWSEDLPEWLLKARAYHANGLTAPADILEGIRREVRTPLFDTWQNRETASGIEREQARLAGSAG